MLSGLTLSFNEWWYYNGTTNDCLTFNKNKWKSFTNINTIIMLHNYIFVTYVIPVMNWIHMNAM